MPFDFWVGLKCKQTKSWFAFQHDLLTCNYSHLCRKEKKKIEKLEPMITYHMSRNDKEMAEKIQMQIDAIWETASSRELAQQS